MHNQPTKNDVGLAIDVIYRPPDSYINSFVAIITDILFVIKAERNYMLPTWGLVIIIHGVEDVGQCS